VRERENDKDITSAREIAQRMEICAKKLRHDLVNLKLFSRYTRRVLTQVLSGGVRREGISAARGNDVTRDGGDFVDAGAAGRGGGRLGTCWMFYDKYKQS